MVTMFRPMRWVFPKATGRPTRGFPVCLAILASILATATAQQPQAAEPPQAAEQPVDFRRQVLPMLSENCFACHGPDAQSRAADLRLDDEAAAKEYAIIPGSPGDSELIARVTSDDPDMRMPPADTGKMLTPEQIDVLKRWIEQGAPWADHWAFVRPVLPQVPDVAEPGWPTNEIDHFVLRKLQTEGLAPSAPATPAEWLRRVSFDLIGLPPTPEELEGFLADTSDAARARVVDRLLQSPHYGERVAVDWLDVARYADSNGYQNDFHRSMWPWRDWVIQAFNDNMPYDQFIVEQVAGDMLDDPSLSQLIATGFNRNHRMVTEAGSIDEEWRVENVVDRVETTAMAFLGLTMGCARCHDHKYDPISQRDFYRFFAFFNNVDEKGVYVETRGNVPPLVAVPSDDDRKRLAEFDHRIATIEGRMKATQIDLADVVAQWESAPVSRDGTSSPALPRWVLLHDRHLVSSQGEKQSETKSDGRDMAEASYPAGQPQWNDGPAGAGLELTGSETSHVTLSQLFSVEPDKAAAWMMWVRADAPGALLSKMDDRQNYRGFDTILLDDFRLKVHLIHSWPENAVAVTSKVAVPRQSWFHLAVSYDGTGKAEGISVWLDGRPLQLNREKDALAGSLQTSEPLRIGRRSSGLYFDGAIGCVQLFDRQLTSDDVERQRRAPLLAQLTGVNAAESAATRVQEYLVRVKHQEDQLELDALRADRARFEKSIQTTMIMRDRAEYRPTYVLRRGVYDAPDKSETLWPEIPEFLGKLPDDAPRNRLGLARWLVDPSNPLVARVVVNRVWQRMFGRGLVGSPDNFGVQGDPPTHPELLDWLAMKFIESGWDLKHLHRLIALSATYGQSSSGTPELLARDPENRLLARGPRNRLPAELVRDNALAVSGLLTRKVGGPSVKPYQPDGLWDELAGGANGGPYEMDKDENLYRRSLYTFRKRTVSHPTLATFDAPSWEICQAKRARTNTPLQALALLNDLTYVEAARHLALRMIEEGGSDVGQQIHRGFLLATLREPTESELRTLVEGYAFYLEYYASDAAAKDKLLSEGVSQIADDQKTPELAALATVASVILNLDETVTKQ